jgi:hypothetical protein
MKSFHVQSSYEQKKDKHDWNPPGMADGCSGSRAQPDGGAAAADNCL